MIRTASFVTLLVLGLVLAAPAPPVMAQPVSPPVASVTGEWTCLWVDPGRGFVYECVMTLVQTPSSTVEGRIVWTLVESPRPQEQGKLGLTAVEFVRGRFDAATRKLTMEGYDKDDPNTIIGLDGYPLALSASGRWLSGSTHTGGAGTGRFSATRR